MMKQYKLSSGKIALVLHIAFWAILLLLPLFFSTTGRPFTAIGNLPVSFYLLSVLISMILFYSNAFFFYPKLCTKRWWWLYVLVFVLLFIITQNLKIIILNHWFPQVEIFGSNAPFIFAPTFFALVAGTVYRFVADRIRAEKIRQEKQAEQLSTELKFLRSQINPHFLFNVLTNLVSLARKKSDQLEPSLIMLSDLMRYMIYDSDDKKVFLEKEVEYLKNYIALQQLRFGNDVEIQTNIHINGTEEYRVEPMLLIPFVENAFKHGVGWIKDPWIIIRLKAEEQVLIFEVENKFDAADKLHKDESPGIGLANVRSRLQLLYPKRHKLIISNKNDIFKVLLTLQLK